MSRILLHVAAASSAAAVGAAALAAPDGAGGGGGPWRGRNALRPSLLTRSRLGLALAPPQVCRDDPVGWADVTGNTCAHYQAKAFCTPNGGMGQGWSAVYGDISSWTSQGKSATTACCACGGGLQGKAPPCTDLACPGGFTSKADAAKLFCKGFACTVADDLDTCCDPSPAVKLAVDETKALIAKLKTEVDQNITAAGERGQRSATANVGAFGDAAAQKFKQDATAERTTAVGDAKTRFASITKNAENLGQAAKQQITVAGYIQARAAVESGAARVDATRLEQAAAKVALDFDNAKRVWESANATSHQTIRDGTQAWDKYHADLNSTWPVLVESIQSINGAIEESERPAQEVRWTEQASRIAADFAHVVDVQVKSLSSQVAVVEERSQKALDLTLANRARVAKLQDMVDKALDGEPSS